MRAPVSWIREYAKLPAGVTVVELADRLIALGLNVERIEHLGADVSGPVVIGRVLSFVDEPQRNGKTIRYCRVDVGELNDPAEGDVPASRGIVCGASNFTVGDYVVVSLPGAVLAGGFQIAARKTYGHISDGMICAQDELGIGHDHTGIIVLPEELDGHRLVPGEPAVPLIAEDEDVLDIDVTPDMGYCLSIRGLAREAAGAFGVPFVDPVAVTPPASTDNGYPVRLESPACPLFNAVGVTGVDAGAPSPRWMRQRLEAAGMRSISVAVDITNYVMLETGQPLHAYDADRLRGPIVVRMARPGERLRTLDDADRALDPADLLITDDSGAIGLAGVMGGASTEVTAATTNVLLEAASFDPVTIARTFRRHKLPSEASKRFERGADPAAAYAAAHRAAQLMGDLAGGTIVVAETVAGAVPPMPRQRIKTQLPASILGVEVAPRRVAEILTRAGVRVRMEGDEFDLLPPTWRPDLVDPYDYVEEVGRKIGFDVLPSVVPVAPPGHGLTRAQRGRRLVNQAVSDLGFVELLSLPFCNDADLDKLQLPPEDPRRNVVRIANPLADTQPYLRTSLLPGLFAAVARNLSRSQTDVALHEAGSVFVDGSEGSAPLPSVAGRPSDDELAELHASLPQQPRWLAAVVAGQWRPAGWQGPAEDAGWVHAVAFAETAAAALGVRLSRRAASIAPWHPGRCAELLVGDVVIGVAGEVHPSVCKSFGMPDRTAAVELDLDELLAAAPVSGSIPVLSSFPLAKEDVALIVEEWVPAADVEAALVRGAGELLESISLFDIYRGPQIGEGRKSLAFGLRFRAPDRTLKDAEAAAARDAAVERAAQECGAVQRV